LKNELFKIGPITIYTYGVMIAIGVMAAWFTASKRAQKHGLDKEKIFDIVMIASISGIIGAKLLYWIVNIKDYLEKPSLFLNVASGYVVLGGIIVGAIAIYVYCRIQKVSFLKYADLSMPSVALAQAFGRIGCFFAGCCYGKETTSSFSVTFHNSKMAPNNVKLIPTQLIFSALNLLHFFVLIYIAKWLKKKKVDGAIAGFYLIFYSIGRFIMEFFRGDVERGTVGSLSTSQFISIFTLIIGLVIVITIIYRQVNINNYNERKEAVTKTDNKASKDNENKDIENKDIEDKDVENKDVEDKASGNKDKEDIKDE